MENQKKEIGARLRELRESCGVNREDLALELLIDPELYRSYEEDGVNIPISVIYHISKKFGVDFTEIVTGTAAKLRTYHVVKRGGGKSVDRYPGYSFEDLAFRFNGKIMQPLLVTLEPGTPAAELVCHTGEEFNLVLEGTIKLVFDGREILLNAGDSVYFNPNYPHGQQCVGDVKARFLTVIAE